jgi:outer membrane protein assembly factor BamB
VQQRLAGVTVPAGRGVAVGVTNTGLVGIALDGTGRWSRKGPVDSRPSIAGDVVVATAGGALFALDGATGNPLWSVPVGEKRLRGAGDDGHTTVATLGSAAGGDSLVVAVDRSGAVLRKWTPEPDVGVPAVISNVVFVPWGNQYVSALDVASGNETGRLLTRTVVSRAIAVGGSVYFGESTMLRFDAAVSKSAENGGHVVKLAERELPGKPSWYPPGVLALPPAAGAPDSIRF